MMFSRVDRPLNLPPETLDAYLDQGWFRMGQTIFTTNFLNFRNQFFSAVWLRIVLAELLDDKKFRTLRKLNNDFTTEVKPGSVTIEKQTLFLKYRESVTFEASSSLDQLLFGKADYSLYDTHEVNVYDGNKLIATGIFDIGATSAAGITCFYDPDYKKYSLGKYLIYLKLAYCKNAGLQFFYPGYFVPGYSFFDYKLEIGKSALQYRHLASREWLPISHFTKALSPLQVMHDQLIRVQTLLSQLKLDAKLFNYEFFDANLIPDLNEAALFDFPLFLGFVESELDCVNQAIVFDVRDDLYHLVKCSAVWKTNSAGGSGKIYASHILSIDYVLFSSPLAEEIADIILTAAKEH